MKQYVLKCFLLGIVVMNMWANESESIQDLSQQEPPQESVLLQAIESADSDFYQAVMMWVRNADEASKFLHRACDQKHPGACLYLGNYYELKSQDRRDGQKNLEQSRQYYQAGYNYSLEACKEGGEQWCTIQAVALIDGRGVQKDIEKGLEYLNVMCEHNIENACFTLGSYYFYGMNTKQDSQKAQVFLHKALELDSQKCDEKRKYACVLSAEVYQQGLSVQMDLAKAKDFYHRACDLNNQFACDYVQKLR